MNLGLSKGAFHFLSLGTGDDTKTDSRQTGKEEDEIVRQLRQRVAFLLVRDNVNMFDSRTPSYPQAVIDADVDINV